ncbi:response regulator [Brasilonema sp. UFV-L1]|uniref:response regulator n=1 Tax=Brasilonema sp. UFV-L1 TaxID=2234130 RepID=UPI0030DD9F15
MSEEEFSQRIQTIRQQIEALHTYIMLNPTQQQQVAKAMEEIAASLENLLVLSEQMQTSSEAMEVIEEELLKQNEYLAEERQRYYDLFEFAPDAYLLTDAQGVILLANRAAGALFNVLPNILIGKPLVNFVAEAQRSVFRIKLNHLSSVYSSMQEWEIPMCPRRGQSFDASLLVAPVRDSSRTLVSLRIIVRDMTQYKQANLQQIQSAAPQLLPLAAAVETPRSLDGLQVLFVDDEADAREFITAVLEQHGICVTAVASVGEALEVLERWSQGDPPKGRSHPDMLISDIRMPDEDGYALIRKVKALEAEKGWRIPTAALTAYLAEDRAKAIKAGFQSHLHKLAEPTELIAMVAQLAGRG